MENLITYLDFIEECKNNVYEVKTHKHHIIPRFMGGGNELTNIIALSYEDHQKAHIILASCFDKGTREYKGNISAASILQMQVSNPNFDMSGENHPRYGESWSDDSKRKISESVSLYYELHPNHSKEKLKNRDLSGDKNPMYGNGHRVSGEKNGRYGGKGTTDETRRKIKEANTGCIPSADTRKIWSEQRKGEGNSMYGKSAYSIWVEKYGKEEADKRKLETDRKKGATHKGKPKSLETREKMRLAALNRKSKTTELHKELLKA